MKCLISIGFCNEAKGKYKIIFFPPDQNAKGSKCPKHFSSLSDSERLARGAVQLKIALPGTQTMPRAVELQYKTFYVSCEPLCKMAGPSKEGPTPIVLLAGSKLEEPACIAGVESQARARDVQAPPTEPENAPQITKLNELHRHFIIHLTLTIC
eukprot:3794065-Amphidinium_carterae.1